MGRARADDLTPREQVVLAAVGRRLRNAEIATELFVSVRTVESHIASLRRKVGADTRAGLIRAAEEDGGRLLAEQPGCDSGARREQARSATGRRDWKAAYGLVAGRPVRLGPAE